MDRLLHLPLAIEARWVSRGSFPLGQSLVLIARKKD
jgi:hypothetical protein